MIAAPNVYYLNVRFISSRGRTGEVDLTLRPYRLAIVGGRVNAPARLRHPFH
jgi:hypothetical protein